MQFDDRMQVQYPLMQPTSLLRDEYVGIVRVAQCGDYSVRVKYDKGGGKLTFECDAAMRLVNLPRTILLYLVAQYMCYYRFLSQSWIECGHVFAIVRPYMDS